MARHGSSGINALGSGERKSASAKEGSIVKRQCAASKRIMTVAATAAWRGM